MSKQQSIYEIRARGREYCQTEGSEHYKAENVIEPIDLIIAKGLGEDFCLASIIKYATRFKVTQNLNDLKKASDYAQILCGIKLNNLHNHIITTPGQIVRGFPDVPGGARAVDGNPGGY